MFVYYWISVSVDYVDGQDFGYEGDKGPTHWGEQYNTCFGKHQSPINIDSVNVQQIKLSPLKAENFDILPNETTIENNGHTGMSRNNILFSPSTHKHSHTQFNSML